MHQTDSLSEVLERQLTFKLLLIWDISESASVQRNARAAPRAASSGRNLNGSEKRQVLLLAGKRYGTAPSTNWNSFINYLWKVADVRRSELQFNLVSRIGRVLHGKIIRKIDHITEFGRVEWPVNKLMQER